MAIGLRWGGTTDVGRSRSLNEDAILVNFPVFAVADGMGGHAAGEVASQAAVDSLAQLAGTKTRIDAEAMRSAVRRANLNIFNQASGDPTLRGMGTTLVALAVDGETVIAVNVGDSRIYRLRSGALSQVSRDHSYVTELVEAGQITPQQARSHPQRNIVTRALGIEIDVDIDVWELPAIVGDRYLLCSDGVVDELSDDVIAQTLARIDDPQTAARELVDLANEHGGHDNSSVVVVDVVPESQGESGQVPLVDPTTQATFVPALPAPSRRTELSAGHFIRNGAFAVLFAAIIGTVLGGVQYYGRQGTYVGFTTSGTLASFTGRPNGVLWVQPKQQKLYPLTKTQLTPDWQNRIDARITFSDQAAADAWFAALSKNPTAVPKLKPPPTTTTTSTTSTTTTTTTTTAPPPATPEPTSSP